MKGENLMIIMDSFVVPKSVYIVDYIGLVDYSVEN